jgi:hypothetical protein
LVASWAGLASRRASWTSPLAVSMVSAVLRHPRTDTDGHLVQARLGLVE